MGLNVRLETTAQKMADSLINAANREGKLLYGLTIENFNTFLDDLFEDGGEVRCEEFTDLGWEYAQQFGAVDSAGWDSAQWKTIERAFQILAKRITPDGQR